MTKRRIALLLFIVGILAGGIFFLHVRNGKPVDLPSVGAIPLWRENPGARRNWEWMRSHDPQSGTVPSGIRERELAFASTLPTRISLRKSGGTEYPEEIAWTQRGPANVGGRTRALAFDAGDPNMILAGGVSGGVWKSTNAGASWRKVTLPGQLHSVTTIVQDIRPGRRNVWYYGTGELTGNSASGGGSALYRGDGVFKSTDGGESWNLLASTLSGQPQSYVSMFQYVWKLAIDPSSSQDELYAATIGGVLRSIDGGVTWTIVRGGSGTTNSRFTDVAVTSTGVVYAALSEVNLNGGPNAASQGVWRSADGVTWTDIRPSSPPWPGSTKRMVIGISPSNESLIYLVGETPGYGKPTAATNLVEYNSLWRYRYISGNGSGAGGEWLDRSANLPGFGGVVGDFLSQSSYNLVIAVHPTVDSILFIGATNLYRSTNGFRTAGATAWIGGYATVNDFSQYAEHHCDLHALVFRPGDPSTLYTGSDGGVSETNDCLASPVAWTARNTGYYTTQFYTCAIDHGSGGDPAIVGGMQDNGTFLTLSGLAAQPWRSLFSGDGSYCAIADGRSSFFVSAQEGVIFRLLLNGTGGIVNYARVDPVGGADYLFLAPFALDPSNNNVLFLAAGATLWRNTALSSIPLISSSSQANDPTSVGWTRMTAAASGGGPISAFGVSRLRPSSRLYYGTSDGRVYRLEGAATAAASATPVDLSTGKGLPAGYVSCIAVDPLDGERALLVMSNYSILSLFSTTNGGTTWSNVSGNLEQNPDGSGSGPSIRWAAIQRYGGGRTYFIGTSTGLYSTTTLAGGNTLWAQEGGSTIGNVVVDMIDVRSSDGTVVVATHGQGVFSGTADPVPPPPDETPLTTTLEPNFPNPFNPFTRIRFTLAARSHVDLSVYSLTGARVAVLVDGMREMGGDQEEIWAPVGLASGMYFAVLTTDEGRFVQKMVYLR